MLKTNRTGMPLTLSSRVEDEPALTFLYFGLSEVFAGDNDLLSAGVRFSKVDVGLEGHQLGQRDRCSGTRLRDYQLHKCASPLARAGLSVVSLRVGIRHQMRWNRWEGMALREVRRSDWVIAPLNDVERLSDAGMPV
jgi:hypothetical protein